MESEVIRFLVGVVQTVLEQCEYTVEGDTIRMPMSAFEYHDGLAVKVDTLTEDGYVLFSLVPYPPE